jgi:uncharacterized protein (TIGR03437 family)
MQLSSLFSVISLLPILALGQQPDVQKLDKEDDDHQAERKAWFYEQRAYPNGTIPKGARLTAIRDIQRIDRAARSLRKSVPARSSLANAAITMDSANWTLIGPQPTNANFDPTYITAGRINAIAIDPRNTNTVYIGAAEGGVWKTTDGGTTWLPLTDNQASLATGAIALDPTNPDIVYVGTGEDNSAQDSYYGAGILKSTDGGSTWTHLLGPFQNDKIAAIAVAPDSSAILCASQQGLWRSTDGAQTWTSSIPGTAFATSVVFDPTDPNNAYAGVGYSNGSSKNGVYHSTNGGVTWTQSTTGTAAGMLPSANVGRIEIALAASSPSTLYVQIQNSSSTAFGSLLGIYKSVDGGGTWNRLTIPNSSLWGNQLWYDNPIRLSPTDPNVVWAGGLFVYRSLDGGVTWVEPPQAGPNGKFLHVDEHVFAFTPDGSKLFIAGDGGVYSTTDVTSPTINWTALNSTLAITQFYPGLSMDPSNPQIALAGAQDNGTQRFNGSTSWDNVACGDGGFTAIDPSMPSFAYASCQYASPQRVLDISGDTWIGANYGIAQSDTVGFIAPMVMDPLNPQTLYFGTYRLWQTQDSGGYWHAVSDDMTGGKLGTIKTIAVAPSDPNTVYVGTSNANVRVTTDMQDGANAVFQDHSAGLPNLTVTHITVDPIDPATAYITYSGFPTNGRHIFKTTNRGASWVNATGNLPNIPVSDLVIDPDLPSTIYIATDAGVMVSTDGASTWSTLGQGLPTVVVTSLTLHRKSRILRAGTHGRSIWDIAVPLTGGSQQPSVSSISPSTANSGSGDFTLTVSGAGFGSSSVVLWNGQQRTTTMVDGSHLTASIPASDIVLIGRASVTVFTASFGGGASNSIPFLIGPGPTTTSAAAVSAANPLGGAVLGQRSISSLYGTNLSAQAVSADIAPPLPFSLGGTTMTIGSNPVPLFYVSPGLVNFQVPFLSVTRPTQVPLVLNQGGQSTTVTVTIQPYAPALFTSNGGGTGQASALVAGTASVAAPVGTFPGSRPIHIGEYLSIYCTGLGDVSPRPALGSPSPSSPLSRTLSDSTVTIGGVPGTVIFSGLAPGFAGLYLVNVQIPPTAPLGASVPIVLSIAGFQSNTATVAVDAAP